MWSLLPSFFINTDMFNCPVRVTESKVSPLCEDNLPLFSGTDVALDSPLPLSQTLAFMSLRHHILLLLGMKTWDQGKMSEQLNS